MTARSPAAQFLSCDWGTSAFRLHLVEAVSGKSLASVASPEGIGGVHQAWRAAGPGAVREKCFLRVLRDQVAKLAVTTGQSMEGLPLVISGMVTASIGLREIPYKEMPFDLNGSDLRVERLDPQPEGFGPVLLVSGARTADDAMRGEEIQIVGAIALGAERNALFVLPGTHSKHVSVDGSWAIDLRTYMTGEFFELLTRRSILANSIEEGAADDLPGADSAFTDGVLAGATENLLHTSFGVRVAELCGRRSRTAGFHYLSGLVVGAELRELREHPAKVVVLVGSPGLTSRYLRALRALGHTSALTVFAAERAVIAGQRIVAERAGLFT